MELDKIFESLDLSPLLEMTTQILAGQTPVMEEYEVKLKIPKAIVDAFTPICAQLGMSMNDLLSKMASEGLQEQLKRAMGVVGAQKANAATGLEGLGIDLSSITGKLKQLESLGGRLTEIQKVFDEIVTGATGRDSVSTGSDNSTKDKKNPT